MPHNCNNFIEIYISVCIIVLKERLVIMARYNIYLNDDLNKQLTEKAKKLSISRSAYISMALTEKLEHDNMIENAILHFAERKLNYDSDNK